MKKIIRSLAMVIVLVFFFALIRKNLSGFDWQKVTFNKWALAGAFVFAELAFMMNVLSVSTTLRFMGAPAAFRKSYCIFFISNLGRYVPGRIWQVMSMGYFAKMSGIPYRKSLLVFGYNQVLVIANNLIFSLVFVLVLSSHVTFLNRIPVWPLPFLCIVQIYPNAIINLLNFGLKILRRPAMSLRIPVSYSGKLSGIFGLNSLFTGLGFACLVIGLGYPLNDIYFLMAAYPLAYVVGYLTLIVPGGIGVREGIIIFLMKQLYPTEAASLIALAALIWVVSVEAINSMVALWLTEGNIFKESAAFAKTPDKT